MNDGRDEIRCVGCRAKAPQTHTRFALFQQGHGWRLTLRDTDQGRVQEWRCPACWHRFKAAKPAHISHLFFPKSVLPGKLS